MTSTSVIDLDVVARDVADGSETAITAEVRGDILKIQADPNVESDQKRARIAERVVEALLRKGNLYYHRDLRTFDTSLYFDGHRKLLLPIASDAFLAWLSDWLCINRNDRTFDFIVSQIENAALNPERATGIVPESYWASREGVVYLSNGDGQVVKITSDGLTTEDNGVDGVVFPAGKTLKPWALVKPVDPFATCSLFRDINGLSASAVDLLRVWLVYVLVNARCKPPLALYGPVGSGKTRVARGMAELLGIPVVVAQPDENTRDDFWTGINAGGLFVLDNADSKIRWLPDALASAATDGCDVRRKKYSDSITIQLRANASVVITSANPLFGGDAGLADRLIVVRMARRASTVSDTLLSDEIAANRDAGLSFVAHTLSKALADRDPVQGGLNLRHPDFAEMAVKIGRALGRESKVVDALRAAESDKSRFCLENDSAVGARLLSLIEVKGEFQGTAREMLAVFRESDPECPLTSEKTLGKKLSNLWPHIESMFKATREPNRTGTMVYAISRK